MAPFLWSNPAALYKQQIKYHNYQAEATKQIKSRKDFSEKRAQTASRTTALSY